MKTRILRHIQVFFDTIGRMWRTPIPTLMTFFVIGVAITLPVFLLQIAQSAEQVSNTWQGRPQLTLVLKFDDEGAASDERALNLGESLLQDERVEDVNYISPLEGLIEFKRTSGFGDVLDALPDSPLPPILVVFPHIDKPPQDIAALVTELENWPNVEEVHHDIIWLKRLTAILDLVRTSGIILSILMIGGVLLIVSNSIRLGISSRRDEIEIIDQIGGDHNFIRRPFLYYGFLQALGGALCAIAMTNTALYFLNQPLTRLAELYGTNLYIPLMGLKACLLVILLVVSLGWIAARVTVGNYLRKLDVFR